MGTGIPCNGPLDASTHGQQVPITKSTHEIQITLRYQGTFKEPNETLDKIMTMVTQWDNPTMSYHNIKEMKGRNQTDNTQHYVRNVGPTTPKCECGRHLTVLRKTLPHTKIMLGETI